MLIVTIREALEPGFDVPEDGADPASRYRNYLVWEGDRPLYAGKGMNPATRIDNHINGSGWGRSAMGLYVLDNRPASDGWAIWFPTLGECIPYIKQHLPFYLRNYPRIMAVDLMAAADMAEQALIRHFRPRYNVVHNLGPEDA